MLMFPLEDCGLEPLPPSLSTPLNPFVVPRS